MSELDQPVPLDNGGDPSEHFVDGWSHITFNWLL